MLIVDLVIVAIILLCVGLGYKRGLTGCLLKIISFILAIIVACILFKPVSILIINNIDILANYLLTLNMVNNQNQHHEQIS